MYCPPYLLIRDSMVISPQTSHFMLSRIWAGRTGGVETSSTLNSSFISASMIRAMADSRNDVHCSCSAAVAVPAVIFP